MNKHLKVVWHLICYWIGGPGTCKQKYYPLFQWEMCEIISNQCLLAPHCHLQVMFYYSTLSSVILKVLAVHM